MAKFLLDLESPPEELKIIFLRGYEIFVIFSNNSYFLPRRVSAIDTILERSTSTATPLSAFQEINQAFFTEILDTSFYFKSVFTPPQLVEEPAPALNPTILFGISLFTLTTFKGGNSTT